MSNQTYEARVNGDVRLTFSANFAEATSSLLIDGSGTPFRVCDARHRPAMAAALLNDWCRSQGGEAWGEGETIEVCEISAERPVVVSWTDGRSDDRYDSLDLAIESIEAEYPDAVTTHDGDLSDSGDRTLVWSDEASSVNDDGANAVASIRWDD